MGIPVTGSIREVGITHPYVLYDHFADGGEMVSDKNHCSTLLRKPVACEWGGVLNTMACKTSQY